MKILILSIKVLIYGWFCDICLKICEKASERRIKKGRGLTKTPLVIFSRFTEKCLFDWHELEKGLICLLYEAQPF